MSKLYYSIGEVSERIDVKPYIIRYWETEFSQLKSKNARNRNRRYTEKDILLLLRIKELVYEQKFTLEGAKIAIHNEHLQKKTEEKSQPKEPEQKQVILPKSLIEELKQIKELLIKR